MQHNFKHWKYWNKHLEQFINDDTAVSGAFNVPSKIYIRNCNVKKYYKCYFKTEVDSKQPDE